MEFTKEMFIVLAKTMSEDKIIEKMEEAINQYKEAKLINQNTNKAMETLKIATHLFIMNSLDKDPMEIIKEMDEVSKRVKFFDTEKN